MNTTETWFSGASGRGAAPGLGLPQPGGLLQKQAWRTSLGANVCFRDDLRRFSLQSVGDKGFTERKQAEERIQYLAHFDTLTGLPNRTQRDDRGTFAISLAQRGHTSGALMCFDLDNFKDMCGERSAVPCVFF